ncbi:MAG: thioredoxin family protein, partial [Culicoidibacterales bacterium]
MTKTKKAPMSGATKIGLIVGGIVIALGLLFGLQFASNSAAEKFLPKTTTAALATRLDNQEDFLVYIGRPTCSACVEFLPKLESAAKTNELIVDYYNVDDASAESETTKNEMLDRLQIEGTPTLLA